MGPLSPTNCAPHDRHVAAGALGQSPPWWSVPAPMPQERLPWLFFTDLDAMSSVEEAVLAALVKSLVYQSCTAASVEHPGGVDGAAARRMAGQAQATAAGTLCPVIDVFNSLLSVVAYVFIWGRWAAEVADAAVELPGPQGLSTPTIISHIFDRRKRQLMFNRTPRLQA
jgi:hypothetical protein